MERPNRSGWKGEPWYSWAALAVILLIFLIPVCSLLSMLWHYLVCFLLLGFCWFGKKRNLKWMAALGTALMLLVSVAGFILVYQGPFAASGKTFWMYVTQYGVFTLPVFLFPLAGLLLTLSVGPKPAEKSEEKQE